VATLQPSTNANAQMRAAILAMLASLTDVQSASLPR
jgi:hypothetical protein